MDKKDLVAQCVKLSFAGLDVGKGNFDAAIHGPEMTSDEHSHIKRLPVKTFARNPEGVKLFLAWLKELGILDSTRVVMESTGRYGLELYQLLVDSQPSLSPAIVHPRKVKGYGNAMGVRSKNDKIDARILAYYGVVHQPASYEPMEQVQREIRDLSRFRTQLVEKNTAEKQRLSEATADSFIAKSLNASIALTTKQIKETEAKITAILKKDKSLQKSQQSHNTLPGVGPVVSIGVIAELGDLSRFKSSNQMVGFVGLSVKENSSGKRKGKGSITKQGSSEVRRLLYLAAMTNVRLSNRFTRFYDRLIAAGKKPNQALVATGRKILVTMRALAKSGETYMDNHEPACIRSSVENL